MRASLLQIAVDDDESVNSRRQRVSSLVREVAERERSGLVVLPELWTTGAFAYESFGAEAEPLQGATYEVMAKAAREAGVWLHAGSIPERAADGALYNTSLVFSPEGELAASYRKIHRFGFDKGEAVLMGAGTELVATRTPEAVLGLATCYDLRFPELFRGLVDLGAEVFVVPAGWPARRRAHWSLFARARAVEDQVFVLACGTAGTHAGVPQAGASVVVDPWGEVLAEAAGAEEEVLTVDLDLAKVAETREQFPALKDRRLS
ncbi:carbon-nitrogen family hydrolase [Streptomyces flavofungini]|uniref:Carbon-nitrogen family hydrolase n=1 Tax=Streptomyces flavofungini TaxID=68200 RepID=A0ABS0WY18_9ACTN|nr:carbon-nitrogen family hydrolase [Streptomyces flavofungini]MBJ3805828.1 carbon-nitrogen family hydrolase [Streptomyces flavofungini]GHC75550.1 hydrolase [Streptomyces flavofungini]